MNFLNKKIPTVLSFLVLVFGVMVTTILVKQGVIFFGHAAPSDVPQNIRITNISDSGFTVTYTTSASVIGTVTITNNGKPQVILDDRDQQAGVPKSYNVHSISVRNLTPQTAYSFTILSGSTTYQDGNKPFALTTQQKITDTPTEQTPLAGKILLPNGTVPSETIVFVTTSNGQLLSTLLNPSGLYILPLNTMRTKDFSSLVKFTSDSVLQILITNGSTSSQATVGMGSINPVPAIVLSQDYDFTLNTKPLATGSATKFPSFEIATNNSYNATPEIITPKTNESFTDQQPQFSGKAAPGSSVTVVIHSDQKIQTTVTTDSTGTWTFRPATPLSPGQHTITITAPDQFGILRTIQQSFTVYAAGSQVNQSATPSATLTPTKAPTSTPTPTIVVRNSTTPTIAQSPKVTPTPTIVQTTKGGIPLTPKPTLPPTGSNTVTVVSVAGIATTAIGILLFLITSGATL